MKQLITSILIAFSIGQVTAQCSDLFFSEYIEGSSSNKSLELFNPTPAPIDLSDYVIYRNNNGSIFPTDSLHPIGVINSMDVYVIVNPAANVDMLALEDTTHSITFFNGDDAVWIKNKITGDTLDIIGEIGFDPGFGWSVGTGATNNTTLIRKMNVNEGETNWAINSLQWDVYPLDMDDSLGFHNMTPCGASCINTSSNIVEIVCDNYSAPDGNSYSSSGIYMATIPNAEGCDSVITIDLTVNYSSTNIVNTAACDSFVYNGVTYTNSGTFTQTYTNAAGCDSLITLILDIAPTPTTAPIVTGADSYCDGDVPADLVISQSSLSDSLIISGVIDGPLPGGLPKAVEFYVIYDIPDLSVYGFGSANNGLGSQGEEYTFPAISATAGTYIHIATDSSTFLTFFNDNPDGASSAANINGDDAVELFHNGSVIDVFGDINVDGTGEPWEYLDGWAYRNSYASPNGGVFNISEWSFSGINSLDGETDNASAATPWPIETYTTSVNTGIYVWYAEAALTTVLGTGPNFTPSNTIGTTSYFVSESSAGGGGCQGPYTQVDVIFNALPNVTANSSMQTVCEGEDIILTGSGANVYTWDNGVLDGVAFPASPSTTDYMVTGTDLNGCTGTDLISIVVNPLPAVTFGALSDLCVYSNLITLTEGAPAGGTYSGNGVSIVADEFDPALAGVGVHTLIYSYTDGNGCENTATSDIFVDSCLSINELENIVISIYPNPATDFVTIESSAKITNIQLINTLGELIGDFDSQIIQIEDLDSGFYTMRITTEYGMIAKQFVKH